MQDTTLEKFLDWPETPELPDAPSSCLFSLQEAVERTTHHAQTYLLAHSFDKLVGADRKLSHF